MDDNKRAKILKDMGELISESHVIGGENGKIAIMAALAHINTIMVCELHDIVKELRKLNERKELE